MVSDELPKENFFMPFCCYLKNALEYVNKNALSDQDFSNEFRFILKIKNPFRKYRIDYVNKGIWIE